ncbi:MAG: COX15/CtaA family protein [Thermoplasmatota archaeon]
MDTVVRIQLLRRLGVVVVAMTFALMVLGSWVKATGSGLACPDWPQCYGQWLPPFPSSENGGQWEGRDVPYTQAQVLYEWGHRGLASLLGPVAFAFAWLAVRGHELHPVLRYLPGTAGIVLVIQIFIGGATVLQGNPAAITTLHLATATLFFGMMVASAVFAFLRPRPTVAPLVRREPGVVRTVYPGEDA